MATINGTTSNSRISSIIEYTYTQSIEDNTSTITAKLYYAKGSSSQTTYGTWSGSITIGSETKTFSGVKLSLPSNSGNVLAATYTETISHNADGSKTITISASGGMSGTSMTSTSCSGTVTLTSIPRKATITAAPNFNDEENPTITYSNKAGDAVTELKAGISTDGTTIDIYYRDIPKTGSSYTFELTDKEREVLRNATTDSNSRTVVFKIRTKIGEKTYWSELSKTLSIVNANPVMNPTVEDTGSVSVTLTGDAENKMIRNYNVMAVAANATAQKGATITGYNISCGGKSITTASGTLSYVSSNDFVFTVTDSRGNSTTQTITKQMIDYINLTCNLEVVAPTTDGDMVFTIKGNYFNGSFGAVDNTLTVQYRYKTNNGDYGDWIALTPTLDDNAYNIQYTITGLNYKNSYTVQARAIDRIFRDDSGSGVALSAEKKVKTTPIFDWGEEDFNFNVPVTITEESGACYDLIKFIKAFTTSTTFETSVTAGTNWTVSEHNATLVGNILRVYFAATRSAAVSGNVTNEAVCDISFDTGGKVASAFNTNFSSGSAGAVATFNTSITSENNKLTIGVRLAATATDLTNTNGYFTVPVRLNINAY